MVPNFALAAASAASAAPISAGGTVSSTATAFDNSGTSFSPRLARLRLESMASPRLYRVPAPGRDCLDVRLQACGRSPDESQKLAEILCGDADQQGDFRNQSVGNGRSQSPAMRFFLAELVDDQQIDTLEHGTLDPCVDARESIGIKAAT